MTDLKTTPLHSTYADETGVKMADFGGWHMPIQFSNGILAEHKAVRGDAGLFDVSHMGEIHVTGEDSRAFLDELLPNVVEGLGPGRCLYTPMCSEDGGVVDDLLVYVLAQNDYLLVVNAANIKKDDDWIRSRTAASGFRVSITDESEDWGQLAFQGPKALEKLQPLVKDFQLDSLSYYHHVRSVEIAGIEVLLSRTGYTGEDGFELYCSAEEAAGLWNAVLAAGAVPCGLGARDILRLEARLPLYGHELSGDISPLEAGLGMFIKLDKQHFIGRSALAAQKERGIPRRLYGLKMQENGVPRDGCTVYSEDGTELGGVTSGGRSPSCDGFIALALLTRGAVSIGGSVLVDIRGRRKRAEIVKTPFYKRKS